MNIGISLIKEKIYRDRLSLRTAATQIGISHPTLISILDGNDLKIETANKIADWLEVDLATFLGGSVHRGSTLAEQIAVVLQREPALAQVFGEAVERLLKGKLTEQTLRDLFAYAAFRLQIEPEEHHGLQPNNQPEGKPRPI